MLCAFRERFSETSSGMHARDEVQREIDRGAVRNGGPIRGASISAVSDVSAVETAQPADVAIRPAAWSSSSELPISALPSERLAQIRLTGATPPALVDDIRAALLGDPRLEGQRVLLDLRHIDYDGAAAHQLCEILRGATARMACVRLAIVRPMWASDAPAYSTTVRVFADALPALEWLDNVAPSDLASARALTVDDHLECFNEIVRTSFPAEVPAERLLVSDELLHSLHECVSDCIVAMRDAGAQRLSALSLVRLSLAELGLKHPVHPAIVAAVDEWATTAYDHG